MYTVCMYIHTERGGMVGVELMVIIQHTGMEIVAESRGDLTCRGDIPICINM